MRKMYAFFVALFAVLAVSAPVAAQQLPTPPALAAKSWLLIETGSGQELASQAADDWLSLLEAFDQPHRAGVVRAAAATMFFGKTAEDLVQGGDELTDEIAETLREWAGHARERGVAGALPTEYEVVGGYGIAVGPVRVIADFERVSKAVIAYLGISGQCGHCGTAGVDLI